MFKASSKYFCLCQFHMFHWIDHIGYLLVANSVGIHVHKSSGSRLKKISTPAIYLHLNIIRFLI
jgi:hypothetical protein